MNRRIYWPIVLIVIAAFVLRLAGIYPGFPQTHPDEGTSYSVAIHMLFNNFNPNRFDYPAGMAFFHAIIFRTIFFPIALLRLFIIDPNSLISLIKLDSLFLPTYRDVLFGPREIYAMYWSRAIAATFGSITVYLLYVVAKRLFNREVGLFSAFFLAVNYRHVLGSHFGLPDIHNAFFALLGLYAAVLLLERNSRYRYMFAGLAAGLSFSIKYQPFAFLPLLLAHLVWAYRTKHIAYIFGKNAWLAVLSALVTFVVINPYYFANFRQALEQNKHDFGWYQMGVMYLRIYPYFYLFHWGIDRLPTLFVVLGAIIMIFRNTLKFLLLFVFIGAFFWSMTYFSNGGIYSRNFVTPMPYLMMLAGYGLSQMLSRLGSKRMLVGIGVLLLINWRPIINVLTLDTHYMKPWNTKILTKWLDEFLPAGTTVRAYQLFLDAEGRDILKRKNINVLPWDYSKGPNSLAEFAEEGTDFAIIQLSTFQSITYWWRQFPHQEWFFRYSEVPYDYILESFYGLTVRELRNYTVAEIYKPWQAADEFGYLIYKIPNQPSKLYKEVTAFHFEGDLDLWHSTDPFGESVGEPEWNKNGKNTSGSLLLPREGTPRSRVSSSPIPVGEGQQYTAIGWIRNETEIPSESEGFLRIDFYDKEMNSSSLDVAISARATSSGEWQEKSVTSRAPDTARFMTVSVQRRDTALPYRTLVDDIVVYESLPMQESYPEVPRIPFKIQWRDMFYNSFL